MIVCPPGYYQSQRDGQWLLEPPDALRLLPIRYREKRKPLQTLRQLVGEILAERPTLTPLRASLPETFVTAEGELAAQTALFVRHGEQLGYIHVAAVFGDDSVDVLDAPVFSPTAFESTGLLIRQLAYTLRLGLGYRKRRYLYTPPLGWTRIAAGLSTRFYPPDFPSHRAMLVMHPAVPRSVSPEELCTSLIERYRQKGLSFESDGGVTPITSDHGLHGLAFCLSSQKPKAPAVPAEPVPSPISPVSIEAAPQLLQDLLVFADAHYLYTVVFESTTQARRSELAKTLSEVARSVRPLPAPSAVAKTAKESAHSAPASAIYL